MAEVFNSYVTAYYTPPKTADGKQPPVEKHVMWQIDYADAKKGKEGDLWSLTPPKAGVPVDDKTPKALVPPPKANPPPAVDRT